MKLIKRECKYALYSDGNTPSDIVERLELLGAENIEEFWQMGYGGYTFTTSKQTTIKEIEAVTNNEAALLKKVNTLERQVDMLAEIRHTHWWK